MKIQELFEQEVTRDFTDKYILTVNYITHFVAKADAIKVALSKANLTGLKVKSVKTISNSLDLSIQLEGRLPFDKANLEHQLKRIHEIANEITPIDDNLTEAKYLPLPAVVIDKLPSSKIEWPMISLYNDDKKPISFAGISKVVVPTEKFEVAYANQISDSILGLLKMKCRQMVLNNASGWDRGFETEKWYKIFAKHWNSDKNVLACQEELIDNELKDFAEI